MEDCMLLYAVYEAMGDQWDIVAIFSTLKNAEEYINSVDPERLGHSIAIYTLDKPGVEMKYL